MAKILLAEPDEEIAQAVRQVLAASGHHVQRARNGIQGLSRALDNDYGALVLNRFLSGFDGIEVLKRLRACGNETPVMLIAETGDVADRVEGLQAGADDYLVQPFALAELLARVHVMLRRSEKWNGNGVAAVLSVGNLEMHLIERTVRRGDRPIRLQSVEFKLLEFLMRNAGRVIKRSALLENVWGLTVHPGTNLLPTHISRLRSKVGIDHGGELIRTVRGVGYVLRTD